MAAAEPLLRLDEVRLPRPGGWGAGEPVSLALGPGEAVGVAGSTLSGAMLVRACLGLATPEAGRIRLLGVEVGEAGEVELSAAREETGAVLDPPGLVANLTVRDNLRLPLVFRHGPGPDDAERRVEEVLEALGLAAWGDERPATLGPGAFERIAVARALVRRPRLLMMENLDAALTPPEIRTVMDVCRTEDPAILLTATETTSAACSLCDTVVDLQPAASP